MQISNLAKVVIRRADGKYLMLRGSVWPERPDRSQKPDLPGGMVEAGEQPIDGAIRETQEEAGIILQSTELKLVYAESFIDESKNTSINRSVFFADLSYDPEVKISWEHEAYEWLSAKEILALNMRDPYPKIFSYLAQIKVLV